MSKTRRGQLFVIAAPSGAGKTSLVKAVLERDADVRFSISHTTRQRRETEVDGKDYYFIDAAEFQRKVDNDEFLEHAKVFDNHYGTDRSQVEKLLDEGRHVLLEIDWQGARQVRRSMPGCVSIFVLPPSRADLEKRLQARSTDSAAVIRRRLRDSVADMSRWIEFDYVVINDDFDRAADALIDVITGHGDESRATRAGLKAFVDNLLAAPR